MDHRRRLKELLIERSLRLGDFTLASGARSNYYIDTRRATMSAEGQALVGRVCHALLEASGFSATHVGGLTMHADPVAYAIAHRSWLVRRPIDAFSVRAKPTLRSTRGQIDGGLPTGAHCVVVEDSMTTGGSAIKAVAVVRQHGSEVLGVLTLVDREEGGRELLREAGLPLLAVFTGAELLDAVGPRA